METVKNNPSNGKKRDQVKRERRIFIDLNNERIRAIAAFRNEGRILWDAEKEKEWGAALKVTSGNPDTQRWAIMPQYQETASRPTGRRTGMTREEKERQDELQERLQHEAESLKGILALPTVENAMMAVVRERTFAGTAVQTALIAQVKANSGLRPNAQEYVQLARVGIVGVTAHAPVTIGGNANAGVEMRQPAPPYIRVCDRPVPDSNVADRNCAAKSGCHAMQMDRKRFTGKKKIEELDIYIEKL